LQETQKKPTKFGRVCFWPQKKGPPPGFFLKIFFSPLSSLPPKTLKFFFGRKWKKPNPPLEKKKKNPLLKNFLKSPKGGKKKREKKGKKN